MLRGSTGFNSSSLDLFFFKKKKKKKKKKCSYLEHSREKKEKEHRASNQGGWLSHPMVKGGGSTIPNGLFLFLFFV
jgi:hypothetical protein